jgi:ACS family glucarate transporter-like MFS transporter
VARCGLGFAAFITSAGLLIATTLAPHAIAKAALLALALGSADLALSAAWAAPLDVAAAHAGVITGLMNTFGNLGGLIGPWVVGWSVDRLHSWTVPFYITAVLYATAATIFFVSFRGTAVGAPAARLPEEAEGRHGEGPLTE